MIRPGARRGLGRRWRRIVALALGAAAVGVGAWLGLVGPGWPSRAVLRDSGPSAPLAFSPDGATLATVGPGGIALWDVAKGRRQADWKVVAGRLDGRPIHVDEATYTPDGQDLVVFYREEGQGSKLLIDRVDPASGVVRSTAETGLERAGFGLYAFNADGKRLRLVLRHPGSGGLEAVDCEVHNGEILGSRPISPPAGATPLAVSPDTRYLALAPPGRGDVCLWGIDGDREILRLQGEGAAEVRSGAFSSDGRTLAIGRLDGSIELWDVLKGARRSTWRGHSPGFAPTMLRFAPDGSSLASSGDRPGVPAYEKGAAAFPPIVTGRDGPEGETIVLDPADGRLIGRAADEGRPTIGPDGDALATASRKDGGVRLRKLPEKIGKPDPLGKRHNPFS